ncbi:MAG: hypothetical protein K8S00_05195 [Bacteroidales bacterium]|nr:hypothetical protein [Bacteroidales bacterium]
MAKSNTIYYQKPAYLCQENEQWKNYTDNDKFIIKYMLNIEKHFNSLGLKVRLGNVDDIGKIDKFCRDCYSIYSNVAINAVTAYDIYRFVKFGNAIMLEDDQKNIFGSVFEVGYDTPDRSSYAMRLAINPTIQDKNLGFLLVEYSCLLGMKRGSLVIRGLVETDNITSFYIVLNKMGWICDGFEKHIRCGVDSGFTISLPLTPGGFTSNRIDKNKLLDYIKHNKAGQDFILIDYDDIDKIGDIYERDDFLVVAALRKGQISGIDQFFALPVEKLNIH